MKAIAPWDIATLVLLCVLAAATVAILLLGRMKRMGLAERHRLLSRTSELLVILDDNLVVRDISRSIAVMYRIPREECIGRKINASPLWPDTIRHQRLLLRALRAAMDGRTSVITYENAGPNGKRGTFELKVFRGATGRRPQIYCLGRDVSIEKTMRETVRQRTAAEDVIVRVSLMAIASDSVRSGIPGILEICGGYLGARRAFFVQLDRDGVVTWNSLWNDPKLEAFEDDWVGIRIADLFPVELKPVFTVMEDLASNDSVPEAYREAIKRIGTGSMVVLTLADRDDVTLGYAGFFFKGPRPDESVLDSVFLRMITATLSGMLSKVEAERDTALFRQSVDAAGQGIAIIDADGRIAYGNRSYASMTDEGDRGSRFAWEIYDGSYAKKVESLILPLVREGEAWSGELRILGAEQKPLSTIESFHPIEIGSDGIRYVVNTITDITERKELEAQLIKAKKDAELASRAKSHYLANMSHEIRTPMNAVIGLTYLAMQTQLDERQSDYLSKINAAAKGLLAIINDILDLSKIESGKLELESAEFSLDEVMENTADMAADKAWEKGLKMYCRRPPGMPNTWMGDRFRLGQVLLNLVGNAVKFTNSGHVSILADYAGPGVLRFTVEDTGIGMTGEQIDKLFQPFSQAEASTARKFGGTGLGLTISKQIVELMGGSFSVTSREGEGSRFSFTAKLEKPENQPPDDTPLAAGTKAWIVATDGISAKYHEDALTSLGTEATIFRTVKDALLEPSAPEILLLDVDGLDHDPAEVATALLEDPTAGSILILTGSRNAAALGELAPEEIPCGILPMPYGRSKLVRALGRTDGSGVAADPRNEGPRGTIVPLGRILLADDDEINRQVGSELLERVGLIVDTAANGMEAVEACGKNAYDIVFMDLQMPVMNGYEAISRIRQDHPDLTVIAMSASTLHEANASIGKSGFTAYLAKPIDPDELYRTIGEFFAIPVPTLVASGTGRKAAAEKIAIPGVDTSAAMRQVLGNRKLLRNLLRRFAEENRHFPERLREAYRSGDSDRSISLLHAIRGAAGYIGAKSLQSGAGELEEALRAGEEAGPEAIEEFCRSVETLADDIASALPSPDLLTSLDRIEEMIRNSDPGTAAYIEDQIPNLASEEDATRAGRIIEALGNWNYDTALDIVDDWRVSIRRKAP